MANDYKDTLFLPQTSFPMRANLSQREPEFLKFWYEIDLYGEQRKKNRGKDSFILHDGPPYANASIHIGTATNKVLKDFIVKYKFLRGYFAPYVPGYDTHGLPTELKVLKELNVSKEEISPVELRERCKEYAAKYIGVQTEQFKRLGVIGDWDNPYITYVPAYEATQLEGFAEMVDRGLIYKGRKAIHWCIDCQTALAAAEIEYSDEVSHSIFVAYPYDDAAKVVPELAGKEVSVIIWTTTPWTLPASQAVAIHPRFDYGFYEMADGKVYLIAQELREEVAKITGLTFDKLIAVRKGAELERTVATHPFYDFKKVPLVLADYVTLDSGTGAVHTAPGHGAEDYETGVRYGLEVYNPVDATGYYYPDTPIVGGKSLSDGESMIFELLEESGRLLGRTKISHSYPHCWRCKKPVIFRATDQWFVAVSEFKDEALKSIAEVQWIPEWGEERITNMVRDRSDWCISRQRIWGVPIPAFYCDDCGEVVLTGERVRRVAARVREEGANCWWALTPEELIGDLAVCPKCGSKQLRKDKDIMDVWFDSGSSHSAVLDNWPDLHWPADMYLEGSDQHRGWFQTSLLNSVATRGTAPYKAVLTHGFIMDGEGKKMSKSLGNIMTPEKITDKYGADILRLWVASSDYRGDVRISQQIFDNLIESYRRIRNTARFLLANLKGFDPRRDTMAHSELAQLDQYLLLKLEKLRSRCTNGLDEYEFHQPMTLIHQFCDNELSSFYIDVSKDKLYADAQNAASRRSIRSVMWETLRAMTIMMAPVLSFTAEEIWQQMREMDPSLPQSVLLSDWPQELNEGLDGSLEALWDGVLIARTGVLRALESARSKGIIGHPLDAAVQIKLGDMYAGLSGKISDEMWEDILIVSSAQAVCEIEDAEVVYQDELTGLTVGVSKCEYQKCPRCWKRRAEVHGEEPCCRCKDVLGE